MESNKFDQWAIIELFGHTQIAGRVTEESIGGCSFLRVDVPEIGGRPGFTKYLGNGAIYSMTPVGEEIARAALERIRPAPISVYIPVLKQLPASEERSEERCERCGEWPEECHC